MRRRRRSRQSRRKRQRPPHAVWMKSVLIDMCARTITIASSRDFSNLTKTLDRMGIQYASYDALHPLHTKSVTLRSEEELRFFLLLLPDGNLLYDNVPSCSPQSPPPPPPPPPPPRTTSACLASPTVPRTVPQEPCDAQYEGILKQALANLKQHSSQLNKLSANLDHANAIEPLIALMQQQPTTTAEQREAIEKLRPPTTPMGP